MYRSIIACDVITSISTFLWAGHCSTGAFSYASHCMLDMSDNYRPVAGYINICPEVSYCLWIRRLLDSFYSPVKAYYFITACN